MRLNEFTIDNGSNDNNRYLNTTYRRFLINEVNPLQDESKIERWEVYNMISDDLIKHGYLTEFDELKYRLSGRENPNRAVLDILSNIERTTLLTTLYRIVESYVDEDFKADFGF